MPWFLRRNEVLIPVARWKRGQFCFWPLHIAKRTLPGLLLNLRSCGIIILPSQLFRLVARVSNKSQEQT
jgi:hypothetical protein